MGITIKKLKGTILTLIPIIFNLLIAVFYGLFYLVILLGCLSATMVFLLIFPEKATIIIKPFLTIFSFILNFIKQIFIILLSLVIGYIAIMYTEIFRKIIDERKIKRKLWEDRHNMLDKLVRKVNRGKNGR